MPALRVLQIKDLKDLSVFLRRGYYRHAGPKGPEEVPFTVGRGPVPRRASIERETALAGVRFSRGSNDRGGQAPALRARKGLSTPCPVRDQALPNYGLLKVRRTLMSIEYAARQVLKVR